MARKPGSSSSGQPSRPDSPMGGSGSTAGSKSGTKSGTRAGTAAGTSAGTRAGFSTMQAPGNTEPAGGPLMSLPAARKPRPALVALAIAGWATFVVQWVLIVVIIVGRGDQPRVAAAESAPPRVAANPSPVGAGPAPAPANRPTPTPAPAPTPRIDASNPFQMLDANALGMPLNSGHTAVLLDAVDRSKAWFDDAKAALLAGLTRPTGNRRASLVLIRDGKTLTYNNRIFNPNPNQLTPLRRFLDPVTPAGSRGLGAGLDAAIGSGANEVVFITSRSTNWSAYLSTLERKLQPSGRRVTLHVVQMGDPSPELRAFVEGANGGRYTVLSAEQLDTWRKAAGL
ncbi:MAG: hypothetical protein AAGG38_05675 [Planctomycetota bacterium]